MKTYIYLHICAIGNWEAIVKRLLNRIKSSGLYDKIDQLRYSLLGDKNCLNNEIFRDAKYINILWSSDLKLYETCTINKIWYDSQEEEFNILYIHSKGVSHNKSETMITNWVEYLTYFNIDRYENCLYYLKDNDVVGVNISNYIMLHYSGNFWWSKSSYIKQSTQYCVHYTYNAPEYWITLSRDGSYIDLFHLEDNFFNLRVHEHNYKNKPLNIKQYKYILKIT